MIMVRLLWVSFVAATLMVSCALPPPVPDDVVTAKYADSPADAVYKKVSTAYGTAKQEGLDFFAPDQFKKGRAAMSKAYSLRRSNAEEMDVLKQLYIAEKQLNICRQVKIQAEKQMPEVLSAMHALRAKSVNRSYAGEFDRLVYQASKVLRDIENFVLGKPMDPKQDLAKEKGELLRELHELEIKVVKYNALIESNIVFTEVKSLGGKRLAPKTFKTAEQALQEANAVIEKNVNDEDAIVEAAKKYEFAVFHALHITRAVDKLGSLSSSDYETYLLDLETKLQAIAEAFEYRDIRNHALYEQIQLLTGLARRLMVKKASLAKASSGVVADGALDTNKLKEQHAQAVQKIQELSDQLAQLQTKQASRVAPTSEQVQKLKSKAAQLEAQVSQLQLQFNNLKAERDSLQYKLDATVSNKGNIK
jgi:hypothetical protein